MLPFLMSEMMRGSPCFLLAAEGDDITLSSHNIQQSTYVQHYCQIQELLLLLLTIRIRNRTVSLSVINSVICKLLICWDDGGEEVKSIKMCFFKWKTKELYTTWVLRLNFFQTWLHLIFLPSLSGGKNRPSLQLNLCHLMFLTLTSGQLWTLTTRRWRHRAISAACCYKVKVKTLRRRPTPTLYHQCDFHLLCVYRSTCSLTRSSHIISTRLQYNMSVLQIFKHVPGSTVYLPLSSCIQAHCSIHTFQANSS